MSSKAVKQHLNVANASVLEPRVIDIPEILVGPTQKTKSAKMSADLQCESGDLQ